MRPGRPTPLLNQVQRHIALHPVPRGPQPRFSSSQSALNFSRSSSKRSPWVGAAAASALLAYSFYSFKPEHFPALPTLHAESSQSTYTDPTTSTSFPTTLVSPQGTRLRLVGSGVRVVSFLSIRVYCAAMYVDEKVFAQLEKVEGWKNFTPDKLLPPFPENSASEPKSLVGEALISNLLDVSDVAIAIIPLRNTTLPHLRDGFSRGLVARLKLPHVASTMSEQEGDDAAKALETLKTFFPGRTLPKGSPMELHYSHNEKSVLFLTKNKPEPTSAAQTLGKLTNPILAKQLPLSYLSDSLEVSAELRSSVAKGFAGEPRG